MKCAEFKPVAHYFPVTVLWILGKILEEEAEIRVFIFIKSQCVNSLTHLYKSWESDVNYLCIAEFSIEMTVVVGSVHKLNEAGSWGLFSVSCLA